MNDGTTPEAWEAFKAREKAKGRNGNGHGETLAAKVASWPSPRSEDSESAGNHPDATDSLTGATKLWTTPQAHDVTARGSGQKPCPKAGNACLARDAASWPTPRTLTGGGESAERKKELGRENAGGGDLQAAAQDWQTPSTERFRTRGGNRSDEMGLDNQAKWATPAASEARQGWQDRTRGMKGSQESLTTQVLKPSRQAPRSAISGEESSDQRPTSRQRLNPAFVCWLMNWPWWWTQPARISFAAAEMELYRSKLRSRLSLLLEGLD